MIYVTEKPVEDTLLRSPPHLLPATQEVGFGLLGAEEPNNKLGCQIIAPFLSLQVISFLTSAFWMENIESFWSVIVHKTMSSANLEEEWGHCSANQCEWAAIQSLDY